MPPKTTIRDIATACGVAPSSVSRVLNNRAGEVGPETRQRILDTVRRLNYRPNQSLDAPSEIIHTLGIITSFSGASWEQNGYFHRLIDNLLRVISEHHHNGLIYTAHIFGSEPQQSIRQYCDGRCDGLLLLAPIEGSPLTTALLERGFPLVMIGTTVQDGAASYCDIDNVHGASLAVNELLSSGHTRIALCQGPNGLKSTETRRTIYLDLLRSHGIEVDPEYLSPYGHEPHIFHDWVQSLMMDREPNQRPTGFVCFNDIHASYVLDRLIDLGFRVPEDASLVGYDDTTSSFLTPPLTTIGQPYRELSQCAVESLLSEIEGNRKTPSGHVLQGHLIRRQSVAPPPN